MQLKLEVALIVFFTGFSSFAATRITSIDFKGTEDPSEITIQSSGPLTYEKTENASDKQVILEFRDATISKANTRKIDTSSFDSNVSLVSPYIVNGQKDTVRVVIQLRQSGSADVAQDGNKITVRIARSGDMAATDSSLDPESPLDPPSDSAESPDLQGPETQSTSVRASGPKTNLEKYVENKEVSKFTGSPVTLQVRDADVADVLRLIGEASGFNIVMSDGVKGKLSLSLVDVPWDQALDVVLHTLHLGAERNNNILRVSTLADLTAEKNAEFQAAQAAAANAPRVTRIFQISYADVNNLANLVSRFASSSPTSGGGGLGGSGSQGGSSAAAFGSATVQVDARTNSLVVRDMPENIEKMKKLIELLDTQTPQVVIEAKVVEASEGFTKSLTGSLGLANTSSNPMLFASFAGGNPVDGLIGSPGVFANGAAISSQSSPATGTPNGTLGFSPNLSFIPGSPRLNALLSWGESENQIKIVSSPKTVVINKQKANIVQGTPILVPGTTTVNGVGTVPTTTVQNANISLTVTPTVTNEGSVLMDLNVTKDVPIPLGGGNAGVGNRAMTTQVIVDSGSTLVIGGVYSQSTTRASSGFPILRKIPILGALFGSELEQTDRTELFFFITPRILNAKEAGMAGNG